MTFRSFVLFSLLIVTQAFADVKILGVGAPCIDIVIEADDKFIEAVGNKGGSKVTDATYLESVRKKLDSKKEVIKTGGSCSNTIKGLANLGHSCAFFGKIGLDDMGKKFLKEISKLRITSRCVAEEGPTQIVMSLVSKDGERTMRCCTGVSSNVQSDELYWDLFSGTKWVHIEGYMLYVNDKEYIANAMRMAKEAGAWVSFNISSRELVLKFRKEILHLLESYVDLVFINKDEVQALLKLPAELGCKKLQTFCTVAVVTLGSEGCLVGTQGQVYPVKTRPIKAVVDSTGAGDLFASGFLHGIILGKPLLTCAHWGNILGGAVCEVYGAEIPKHKWPELRKKLQ